MNATQLTASLVNTAECWAGSCSPAALHAAADAAEKAASTLRPRASAKAANRGTTAIVDEESRLGLDAAALRQVMLYSDIQTISSMALTSKELYNAHHMAKDELLTTLLRSVRNKSTTTTANPSSATTCTALTILRALRVGTIRPTPAHLSSPFPRHPARAPASDHRAWPRS